MSAVCGQPDPTGAPFTCTGTAAHAGRHSYPVTAFKNPGDPTYASSATFNTVYTFA